MKKWNQHVREVKKLSLQQIENEIREFHSALPGSRTHKDIPLELYLAQRRNLINEKFEFTPDHVKQIERVNRILTECTDKLVKQTILLYRQMLQVTAKGNDFLTDFSIRAKLSVEFNGPESVMNLATDENEGQSDYETMAEILVDVMPSGQLLHDIALSPKDDLTIDSHDEDFICDPFLKKNWKPLRHRHSPTNWVLLPPSVPRRHCLLFTTRMSAISSSRAEKQSWDFE